MKLSGSPFPVTAYMIPPAAPEDVAAAYAEFQRVASLFEDASDDLRDARHAITAAKARDVAAIVEATRNGKEPKDPQHHEREAQAEVERLGTLIRGYSAALDQAGNELAQAIERHKDEWSAALSVVEAEAVDVFERSIGAAREVSGRVAYPSRGPRPIVL